MLTDAQLNWFFVCVWNDAMTWKEVCFNPSAHVCWFFYFCFYQLCPWLKSHTCYWLVLRGFSCGDQWRTHITHTYCIHTASSMIHLFALKMVSHYVLDFPLLVMFTSLTLAWAYSDGFRVTGVGYIFNSVTSCSFPCLQWKKAHKSASVDENRWSCSLIKHYIHIAMIYYLLSRTNYIYIGIGCMLWINLQWPKGSAMAFKQYCCYSLII